MGPPIHRAGDDLGGFHLHHDGVPVLVTSAPIKIAQPKTAERIVRGTKAGLTKLTSIVVAIVPKPTRPITKSANFARFHANRGQKTKATTAAVTPAKCSGSHISHTLAKSR